MSKQNEMLTHNAVARFIDADSFRNASDPPRRIVLTVQTKPTRMNESAHEFCFSLRKDQAERLGMELVQEAGKFPKGVQ